MKKIFTFLLVAFVFISCAENIVTGRKQLSLVSETELQSMAKEEYKTFLTANGVVNANTNKDAEMVRRVGSRIAAAIKTYYDSKGQASILEGYQWEFNLVDNKDVNAWCMPGGKVVVYTGLLAITQNEAALAVVMGHEITHAVAHHGNERMSQGELAKGLEIVGNLATANNAKYNSLFSNIFAPTAQVAVLLPNSRKQEYDADRFGIIFAAMSGYNPREAIPF